MKRCQGFIPFQGEILQLNEFGGMDSNFIAFNPILIENKIPDYKMQISKELLLKFDGEDKLTPIEEVKEHFLMVNSLGRVILDSHDTKPEFVTYLVDKIFEDGSLENMKSQMN